MIMNEWTTLGVDMESLGQRFQGSRSRRLALALDILNGWKALGGYAPGGRLQIQRRPGQSFRASVETRGKPG